MTWITELSNAELSDAIESTGAMSSRLYAQGADTSEVDARLDDLMAEFERRASSQARGVS